MDFSNALDPRKLDKAGECERGVAIMRNVVKHNVRGVWLNIKESQIRSGMSEFCLEQ